MTGPGLGIRPTTSIESQLALILERLDEKEDNQDATPKSPASIMTEVRTLELWRSVISECLASVFFVFLVCGAYSPWNGKNVVHEPEARIVVAMVEGLSMAVLLYSFGQVSGGHLNPAVSVGFAITRKVSPLRAVMFILAQLGGGIAGAALLYGATSSGYSGDLGATTISSSISLWQGFGLEFILTMVVVFTVFAAVTPYRNGKNAFKRQGRDGVGGSPAIIVGIAYMACTLVGFPLTGASMNPARSLGPAFVMNNWDKHWVYWVAPLLGGVFASLIYEYIFNPSRTASPKKDNSDGDSISIGSDEEAYDECSKPPPRYNTLRANQYDQYRPASTHSPMGYASSVYEQPISSSAYTPSYKYEGYAKDEIYSGTKSMYGKTPPLPRTTSLSRSQSVYTRPPPPRSDTMNHNQVKNIAHSQNICKSPGSFTALLQNEYSSDIRHYPKNLRQDSLYATDKIIVKPEPVYGVSAANLVSKHPDSGDSSYSTYRGSGSYSSSRSSGQNNLPPSRSRQERVDINTPISSHSGLTTPNSIVSYHSPNPQY